MPEPTKSNCDNYCYRYCIFSNWERNKFAEQFQNYTESLINLDLSIQT